MIDLATMIVILFLLCANFWTCVRLDKVERKAKDAERITLLEDKIYELATSGFKDAQRIVGLEESLIEILEGQFLPSTCNGIDLAEKIARQLGKDTKGKYTG